MKNNIINIKPKDFLSVEKILRNSLGLATKDLEIEPEGYEYSSCRFKLHNHLVIFRSGKITPTKKGLFVTFWKRSESGSIAPYDICDPFDFLMIKASNIINFGLFIFPKSALMSHQIISSNGKEGKRAFRIYPPWSQPENKQGQKTQEWQLNHFYKVNSHHLIDPIKAIKLFR